MQDRTQQDCRNADNEYCDWVERYLANRPNIWRATYDANKKSRLQLSLGRGKSKWHVFLSAARTFKFYPRTRPRLFVLWFSSADEALRNDWYKVGADIHRSMQQMGPSDTHHARDASYTESRVSE
jgi:hypothetical protein